MDKPEDPVSFDVPAALLEVPAVLMEDPKSEPDEIPLLSGHLDTRSR